MSKLEEEYTLEPTSLDWGYNTYICNTTGKEIKVSLGLDKEDVLRLLRYQTLPFKEAVLRQGKDAGFSEEEIVELLSK